VDFRFFERETKNIFMEKKIRYFYRKINCPILPPDIYSWEDIKLF